MIIVKMYERKWRISIGDETWEFPNVDKMFEVLHTLIEYKEKYGDIRKKERLKPCLKN
jgi:hypothetical protein